MFWKKKTKTEEPLQPAVEKLPGPRSIEELVGRQMVVDLNRDPDWVWQLRSVVRRRSGGAHRFDFRVFDEAQIKAKRVKVKNYASFDSCPELVLYQGWFDKVSMEIHIEEKEQMGGPVTEVSAAAASPGITSPASGGARIFTGNEIWQRIVGLSELGGTVFFYLTGSPASGGPLGRGAAIVELNPNYPGKKQKRYNLYTSNVDGGQPVVKRQKMSDSDSSKEIARYIKERHF